MCGIKGRKSQKKGGKKEKERREGKGEKSAHTEGGVLNNNNMNFVYRVMLVIQWFLMENIKLESFPGELHFVA